MGNRCRGATVTQLVYDQSQRIQNDTRGLTLISDAVEARDDTESLRARRACGFVKISTSAIILRTEE
jgi:hypothetical protein